MQYHKLDNENTQKTIFENAMIIENKFREYYINRIKKLNQASFEANPSIYRFYYKENCSILSITIPYEFDARVRCETYFLSTPGKRELYTHVMNAEDMDGLDSLPNPNFVIYNRIFRRYGFDKTQLIANTTNYVGSDNQDYASESFSIDAYLSSQPLVDYIESTVIESIRNDARKHMEISQTKLSYFAKDVAKFPFSRFNLPLLIEVVNDNDFSYQLDQAMAAYHQNLFLPCAATLGVCLETLCIKVCEKYDVKIKGGETQLGVLKDRLSSEKKISKRDNGRLEIAYRMRNLTAHTSPGETLKEDCHFMLSVINEIAHQHLQPDNI